jgi:hypothetical protein
MRALVPASALVFTELAQCRTDQAAPCLQFAIMTRISRVEAPRPCRCRLLRSQKIVVGQP